MKKQRLRRPVGKLCTDCRYGYRPVVIDGDALLSFRDMEANY